MKGLRIFGGLGWVRGQVAGLAKPPVAGPAAQSRQHPSAYAPNLIYMPDRVILDTIVNVIESFKVKTHLLF